ncbi:hypothetical protein J6590_038744 [Homalodisca vitripennis]|nr:hypothetical protein J6590_038744 [Homalodisca vitripennis]
MLHGSKSAGTKDIILNEEVRVKGIQLVDFSTWSVVSRSVQFNPATATITLCDSEVDPSWIQGMSKDVNTSLQASVRGDERVLADVSKRQ